MDIRGFPTSLPEFQRVFPDDAACARYLETIRWPSGFAWPKCGLVGEPYRFATRSSVVLRCRGCKANTSLTAGTVMQSSHTPLSTWFWGAYLMTTQIPGQSAVQFQRQLGLSRYETAFQILHKLRAGMVRPLRDTIGGEHPVEVDECLIGGETRGEGRGIHHRLLSSERSRFGPARKMARNTDAVFMRGGCAFASFRIGPPRRSPDLSKRTLSTVLSCVPMDGPVTRGFLRQDTVMTC